MKSTLSLAICLMVAILSASPLTAGDKKKKAKAVEHYDTVIASVAADAITIDENKIPKSFKITQFTEVTLRGQRATVADLKPGMLVSVTMGSDRAIASRIAAGDPPVHIDRPKPKVGKMMK